MKTDNAATGIFGVPIDPETGEQMSIQEHQHYYTCEACKQAVDRRDLGQVFHHEDDGHLPLALDS